MITEYGMSEKLPLRTFGGDEEEAAYGLEHRDYGEEAAKQIDEEVHRLLDNANAVARTILRENQARLIHLAEKLIIAETLEGSDLERVFTEPVSPEETDRAKGQVIQPVKAIAIQHTPQGVTDPTP